MNTGELRVKYTDLSKKADHRCLVMHEQLKTARNAKNHPDSGREELTDYLDAKDEHIHQKQICQIYGQICHDIGDT